MKVFVTGGAGYIGSICVEQMLDEGLEVAVFDNLSEGHRAAVDPRARFYEGDFGDAAQIARALREFKPTAIMHFAANALVGESMTNPAKYFRNNVGNAVNLLEAAVHVGVEKFVFSSTCATYGIPERVPMDESLPQRPINPYGESKLMFEKILAWFSKLHGIKHVNLRYFNAAGATEKFGEDHRIETHLIPNVLKVALGQKEHVEIFGTDYETPDGTCIRDYIHIVDLYQAHRLALDYPESDFFNLGTGQGNSVREVIDTCRRITGHAIPVKESPRRPGDPPRLVASADKAREKLGWKPKFDNLDAIIGSAWKWHVKNPHGYSKQ
ncbi:UDP-glucose 4-epimerase GalE [Kamptonema cortianum]|nr:UDP-glucose 4-epimerase GalE [Oscillatoria laete-virens]MDK3156650.1 UDP-glucose 4-epimerase GalE [Kamptonema cortianum]MDL5050341.1 UDP-glucose 4-epimerase GalE [Oscillatoria amoena NRMC-F 0135]MDL5053388.1 UDP-glucose 4-epimerase GalE [Oscillatoria laete-virens NRMC-F 0139]